MKINHSCVLDSMAREIVLRVIGNLMADKHLPTSSDTPEVRVFLEQQVRVVLKSWLQDA
jgi:hypothetical protein